VSKKGKNASSASAETGTSAPIVTLLSDFGAKDGFVGILKGVVLGICPQARLVDLSHDIAPQEIVEGALVLAAAVDHFPRGTVHLAVVDPGVGTQRRALLIETEAFTLVGPDNGLLSLAAERSKVRRIVHLDRPQWFAKAASTTFHGRDVFAPVAAHHAAGVSAEELGSVVEEHEHLALVEPRRVDDGLEGQVIYVDRFGNLICNVRQGDVDGFRGQALSITIGGVQLSEVSPSYASVREGRPVAVWNSWGRLEVAVRNGSAVRQLRARNGERVQVKLRR
jgi:S-adenosylmethionine hydrolase